MFFRNNHFNKEVELGNTDIVNNLVVRKQKIN